MNQVLAVVGAQNGSEGKGCIVAPLAQGFDVHIRTGGPNAGHTFYHEGEKWVARSVPIGWINPQAEVFIGPGALVDAEQLFLEVDAIERAGYSLRPRLLVDTKASLIHPVRHRDYEGGTRGFAHQAIGSTGEGVGLARMGRLARGTVRDLAWASLDLVDKMRAKFDERGIAVGDTAWRTNTMIDGGAKVLLEGTQGSGLSVVHGPWPYVTSWDTNAGQLAVDAGIAPQLVQTLLVARTHPIRVAGNSGPLQNEVTWAELDVPEEITTVTKKVRRVGTFEVNNYHTALRLNRPLGVCLNFLNYVDPDAARTAAWASLPRECAEFVQWVAGMGAPVLMGSTSPMDMLYSPEGEQFLADWGVEIPTGQTVYSGEQV